MTNHKRILALFLAVCTIFTSTGIESFALNDETAYESSDETQTDSVASDEQVQATEATKDESLSEVENPPPEESEDTALGSQQTVTSSSSQTSTSKKKQKEETPAETTDLTTGYTSRASVSNPGIKFSFARTSNDNGQDVPGLTNTTLIGNGEELYLTVTMNPVFTTGQSEGATFQVTLPYIYFGEDDEILTTTNIEAVPEEQRGKMGVQARIVDAGSLVFPGSKDSSKVYTGMLDVTDSTATLTPESPLTLKLAVSFYSSLEYKVPENASVNIHAGGAYGKYYDAYGNESEEGYSILPGKGDKFASWTLINSNLRWEGTIEQVDQYAMWDKYNYMTYKVTMKNISDDEESYFDSFDINIDVPSYALGNYGVLDEDIVAWYKDSNGGLVENTDFDISNWEHDFVGVPEKGGVLAYDVTGIPQETLDKLDTETYSNVHEILGDAGETMIYHFANDRKITIPVEEQKVMKGEERVYYVAIPFTNNFPASLNYTFVTKFLPTIYLGQEQIAWTKTYNLTTQFAKPVLSMTAEKYLLDDSKRKQNTLKVGVSEPFSYYISGIKNTGNIPGFQTNVVDTLPNKFNLTTIRIQIDYDTSDADDDPQLTDWFLTDDNGTLLDVLEFEFKNNTTGATTYRSLGNFTGGTDTEDGTAKEWTINAGERLAAYLASHTGETFTRNVRINFRNRINKKLTFNGRIIIDGYGEKVIDYKNEMDLNYQKWLWAPSTTNHEGNYSKTNLKAEDSATASATPGNPIIRTDGYELKEDLSEIVEDPHSAAVDSDKIGYRFTLGNDSISPIVPGIFTASPFLEKASNGAYYGFKVNRMILSKELLDNCDIKNIVIKNQNGERVTIAGSSLTREADGSVILYASQWQSSMSVKNTLSISIEFNRFNKNIQFSDKSYVTVIGSATKTGNITVTGNFTTDYDTVETGRNWSNSDNGTLNVQPANPLVWTDGYELKTDGTESKGDPLSVGLDAPNVGFRYTLANNSISAMTPGRFTTSAFLGQGSDGNYYGLDIKKMVFSKELLDRSEVKEIILEDTDGNTTTIDVSVMTPASDGTLTIEEAQWSSALAAGNVQKITINFDRFDSSVAAADKAYFTVIGKATRTGDIKVTSSMTTLYDTAVTGKNWSDSDEGILRVGAINPVLTAQSYDASGNYSGKNTPTTSSLSYLTVANKQKNHGYLFEASNQSGSSAGTSNMWIDFSSSVGQKDTIVTDATPVVKGFKVQEVYLSSNYASVCKIRSIDFWDWNQNPATDTPALSLSLSDIEVDSDGRLHIKESQLNGMTRVLKMCLRLDDFYGNPDTSNPDIMKIQVDGTTDWFDNLDAKLTFEPLHPYMQDKKKSVTGRLYVKRPGLMIHTNIYYYDLNETSHSTSSSSDGYYTRLGIPYDRDFKYRVSIENTEISVCDDVDVTITLPPNGVASGETDAGFHTTKILMRKEFVEQFGEVETLTLSDLTDLSKTFVFTYDETTKSFSTSDGKTLAPNAEGHYEFTQAFLKELGISQLGKIIFSGDDVKLKDASTANAWMDIYGYSDSLFGTENPINAKSDNYLDGIREDKYRITRTDSSVVTVSKMYFDTVLIAGYKDTESAGATLDPTKRMDEISTPWEQTRIGYRDKRENYYCYEWHSFLDDSELEIGYKAIGSFLLDYRQYLNVGGNLPEDYTPRSGYYGYYSQEHQNMNWIYTQSLNTAVNVDMTLDLPEEFFDAYYVKVHPKAIDYLNSITLIYKDGTESVLEKADWTGNISSIEKDADGNDYYVVELVPDKYKSPDMDYTAENPISKVIFNLDINEKASDDGTHAKNPDYGTWYRPNNQETKYMFEVTGRFYKTGTATATASTELTVGGTEHGTDTSKQRVENTDTVPDTGTGGITQKRSAWSYSNTYDYKYGWWGSEWRATEYDAQHMLSTTKVVIQNTDSNVLKGVHNSPSTNEDDKVEYSKKNYYAVSFWRTSKSTSNYDYIAGNNNWSYQDIDDWAGKMSHADEIILEDTLPTIRNDATYIWYGFLTEDILISEALYKYIDRVELTFSDASTQTLTKAQLGAKGSDNYYKILFKYIDQDANATSNADNEIVLTSGTFVKSYKIILHNLPGSADYARELFGRDGLQLPDTHGSSNDIDVKIGGYVYLVKDIHPDKDGTNKITSSQRNDYQTTATQQGSDTGRLMGFRKSFKAGHLTTRLTSDTEYDYESDNLTAHTTSFGVKMWNKENEGTTPQGKASRIKTAKMSTSLPDGYNLKKIHIPGGFVNGTWFNLTELTLRYNGNTVTLDKAAMQPYLVSEDGGSYFDADKYMREHLSDFASYTVYIDDAPKNYVKEFYEGFDMKFEAVSPDVDNDDTLLAAGQYLSTSKTSDGYAFTYDGVWVDRTTEDAAAGTYTSSSRPTFAMTPNGSNYHQDIGTSSGYLNHSNDATFVAADMNAKEYEGDLDGTNHYMYYTMYNRVGEMVVDLERGTMIDGILSFAYDRDCTEADCDDTQCTVLPVDKNHLAPYDYIDYTLTLSSGASALLPLQHTDLRFTVPKGQRIVGWEIVSNDTDIAASEITATVTSSDGTQSALRPEYYAVRETASTAERSGDPSDTDYKVIDIALGDYQSEDDDQIKQGQTVKIKVYTQLTEEYVDASGNPAYEGQTTENAVYEAASRLKHTYGQYSITGNGNGGTSTGHYSTDNSEVAYYYRQRTNFLNNQNNASVKSYTSQIYTNITYRDYKNIYLKYTYDDTNYQYDRQPMTIKMTGKNVSNGNEENLTNDLRHTLEKITYEISFMTKESDGRQFKAFELTEKPELLYPSNMDGVAGKSADIEYRFLKEDGTEVYVKDDHVYTSVSDIQNPQYNAEGELVLPEGYYMLADAVGVRWTYENIPAYGNDGNEVLFASTSAPYTFKGLGLYNNIRTSETTHTANRWTMKLDATVTPVHNHLEHRSGNEIDEDVEYLGKGAVSTVIAREFPILTWQTQIFASEEEAEATYAYNRTQMNGYRPGDTMWYKMTVINNKAANPSTGMQGALLNPTFYDKVPEYVTADMSQVEIRWYDKNGDLKATYTNADLNTKFTYTVTDFEDIPDYGGDMVVAKATTTEGARGNMSGRNFNDNIIPTADNSTKITYKVYQFRFIGETPEEEARLEVGERIELWYPAEVREENLPMVYVKDADGNVYPEYYPKMGEYYQLSHGTYQAYSWPLTQGGSSGDVGDGQIRRIQNSDIMMDMSYLIHDAGVTGTINKDVDRWEFLSSSTTYIPGSASNDDTVHSRTARVYGNNGRLLDYDSASGSVYQAVTYVPSSPASGSSLDVLPPSIQYQGASNANRDLYRFVVAPRTSITNTDWDGEENSPILWSEARSHLQTAWLATSSEIVPQYVDSEAFLSYTEHARQYLTNAYTKQVGWSGATNPNYGYYVYNDYGQNARHSFMADDYIPTIEYNEEYYARLSAYNYGDWSVDGVEFTYILPKGISPVMDDDGNIIISGQTLTGGDSRNPVYSAIDAENISYEVLQTPEDYDGYLSPKMIQDPQLSTTKWNTTTDVYDEAYYTEAESDSWVLRITVKHELSKWFNRGSNLGYILNVNIKCRVDETNESEYWYDQVYTRPIDINDSGNSLYYQVYDITSWQGATKDKSTQTKGSLSVQYGGMDYLWDGYDEANDVDTATAYNNGSPNTPYINGFNIQNKEIRIDTDKNGVTVTGDQKDYYATGKTETYASTGTRAHMRKPLVRTWTTLGSDLNGTNLNNYYLNAEADHSTINIHVENKYWWHELSTNGYSPMTGSTDGNSTVRHLHNYSTDGGNEGTLFYPVVTDILPYNVVPLDTNGEAFTTDNASNQTKTLAWRLYTANNTEADASEKALYKATVEYIEMEVDGGGTEGRYKVTIYSDEINAVIKSGDKRIFSFSMMTVGEPDNTTAAGATNGDLLTQYQTNHIYVTSQLTGYKFLLDSDIAGNPYYVSASWQPYYASKYNIGDSNRKDSVVATVHIPGTSTSYSSNYRTSGTLPNSNITLQSLGVTYSIVDSVQSRGNWRYNETDTFNLEDYSTVRHSVTLTDAQKNFNLSTSNADDNDNLKNALTHMADGEGEIQEQGAANSMRIRIKYPRIAVDAYVSDTKENIGLTNSNAEGKQATHYPTSNFDRSDYTKKDTDHKQYGDHLWYSAKISNGPSSASDYSHKGDVLHSKIILSVTLPSIVTYEDEYYIEYTAANGTKAIYSAAELKELGWQIKELSTQVDTETLKETHVFEIITPAETNDYDEFVLNGKHLAGYFASGDSFTMKLKTVIDHAEAPETITAGLAHDYWDEAYQAQMYVNLHDTAGTYTGLTLTEQSMEKFAFVREKKDSEASDTTAAVDYDLDGVYDERYTSDETARVTVLKPSATVRLDTSINRYQLTNPDAEEVIAEDASIKGGTESMIYMDQAVSTGGAVGEFIVDYRVPYRGTRNGTAYEAPMDAKTIITTISEIRTGVWELPAGSDEILKEKLKVNVYILVEDPNTISTKAYTTPGTEGEYTTGSKWKNLGSYGLDENAVIPITDEAEQVSILQIRFVIKADDSEDPKATQKYPVPQGFRMDIDADETKAGKQEMDEVDPGRNNVNITDTEGNVLMEIVPENVKTNAAYIKLRMKQSSGGTSKVHANNFATIWGRYDDTQYAAISEAGRAGYFINVELPVLQKELIPYYYHQTVLDDNTKKYEWSSSDLLIRTTQSSMLKYKSSIKNLSDEEIQSVGMTEEQDNATNLTISVVPPYMQDIDDANFEYVDAYSSAYNDAYINDNYTSQKQLRRAQAQWTWYVVDSEGNMVVQHRIKNVTYRTYEKEVDLTGNQRKVLTWNFEGYLEPGQTIVVDYMVPISTKDYGIISNSMMRCSSYGYIEASFKGYIPPSASTNEAYSIELDTRDINDNGRTNSETALAKKVSGLAFESTDMINRLKYSYTEYNTKGSSYTAPALLPEGTDYSFRSAVLNPDQQGNPGFYETIIYDVLPYKDDKNLVNTETVDGNVVQGNRNSKWAGWLLPETISVTKSFTTSSGVQETTLRENTDYEVWVGPFVKEGGNIVLKTIDDLPEYELTAKTEFYSEAFGNEATRRQYFVKLSEFMQLKNSDPERYVSYSKQIQAIWIQIKSKQDEYDSLAMNGSVKFELNYSLHAPLNLPQYPGAITEDMDDSDIIKAVADYTGWNTFSTQSKKILTGADMQAVESPQAGVYLNAPIEKGYIGSYVWYDKNYNTEIDEGEYERREDGRLIFKNATTDLDYDGTPDDPGINGVLVELLSENGYPVNKKGEAVVTIQQNGETRYILVDEATGQYKRDINGSLMYTTEGPASFTTEADAYGNNGYFIISNITPGNYKLRYTFPEKTYNQYAVTTLTIGDTNAKVQVYRDGDTLPDLGNAGKGVVDCDAMKVENHLVVQTTDSIRIDAVGTDTESYPAYDEKMTSYNVGVSRAIVYAGYAWLDETEVSGNITSDGLMASTETKLDKVKVKAYEVAEDGTLTEAYDADGNLAETVTGVLDGRPGYYELRLKPDKDYILRADSSDTGGVYKPSPITLNTNPLKQSDDNDLRLSSDKKFNETGIFHSEVQFDTSGKPKMNADGNYGTYKDICLGFVEAGRGYIGKYVWDDLNYNGIRDSYVDADGNVTDEPGIGGVKFILEKYYYDPIGYTDLDTGKTSPQWIYVENADKTVSSNTAGTYIFQNVSTYHSVNGKAYLAGYKVRVDMRSIPDGYVITKFQTNDGKNDSDVPVLSTDGYLQVSDNADVDSEGMILMAERLTEDSDPTKNVIEHEDVTYNLSDGKMLLDLDLGLTKKESPTISGKIWDDKNYDGLMNTYDTTDDNGEAVTEPEPGIENVELVLEQYYYKDSKWVKAGNYVSPTIKTGADGRYEARDITSYVTIDGVNYLAGYKIKVKDFDASYAVTKYKAGDGVGDSKLIDANHYLLEDDEYIITAKRITGNLYDTEYIIQTDIGNFDINKIVDSPDNDGGLVKYQRADISGKIWEDKNYDGLMNAYDVTDNDGNVSSEAEPGIADVTMTLHQYYLDDNGKWQTVPQAQWNPEDYPNTTDANGEYIYKDLANHVDIDGKHYLAGYRILVDEWSEPDKALYGITLYRADASEDERSSDLTDAYVIYNGDSYILLADVATGEATEQNSPYLAEVDGVLYDYVTAKDNPENDGGFTAYQTSEICGNVFEDMDYDGLRDYEETYAKIKEALADGEVLEVTLTAYYLDNDGEWHPVTDTDGNAVTRKVQVAEDGSYSFKEVATQFYLANAEKAEDDEALDAGMSVSVQHYLAGYKLTLSQIPKDFAATKRLKNNGVDDSSLYDDGKVLHITKTKTKKGYVGERYEEMDGYIIAAAYAGEEDNHRISTTMVKGYDLLGGRILDDYNAGLRDLRMSGDIVGTIFEDLDYNGFFDEDSERGINGIEVVLEQYYLNEKGKWVRTEAEDVVTTTQTIDGKDGIFKFEALENHIEKDGTYYLVAYKVRVPEIPQEYAVTKLNSRSGDDVMDESRDSDLDIKTGYLVSGNGKDADEALIIIAAEADADELDESLNENYLFEYKGITYDILDKVNVNDYDGGLTPFVTGSIEGMIFNDADYDGFYAEEDEEGINGIEVILEQFYLDDNGEWVAVEREVAPEETETETPFESEMETEETESPLESETEETETEAETESETETETESETEAEMAWLLLNETEAESETETETESETEIESETESAQESELESESESETEIEIEMEAVVQKTYSQTIDGVDGIFRFTGLPTFIRLEDGSMHLTAYRVSIPEVPEKYAVTLLNQRSDADEAEDVQEAKDSDLQVSTGYLVSGNGRTADEAFIFVMDAVSEESTQYDEYILSYKGTKYDIMASRHVTEYDAGLLEYQTGSIEGIAFVDVNRDGIYDADKDKLLSGIKVLLKKYYYDSETNQWTQASEGYDGQMLTDADGRYFFDGLETYKKEDDKLLLCGYRLWIEAIPNKYQAAKYQANGGVNDSALVASDLSVMKQDKLLNEVYDGYLMIAHNNTSDAIKNTTYTLRHYDIVGAENLKDYNIGLVMEEETPKTGDTAWKPTWLICFIVSGVTMTEMILLWLFGKRKKEKNK